MVFHIFIYILYWISSLSTGRGGLCGELEDDLYLGDNVFCFLAFHVNGSAFNLLLGRSHISSGGQEQWPVWYPPNPSNSAMVSYCPLNIFLHFGHDGCTLSSYIGTDWKTWIRQSTWRWYTISTSDCKY